MLRVIEINQVAELAPFRAPWNALLAETAGASYFQSYDWLLAHWQYVNVGRRLRVFVVCEGERPVGLFPLNVQTERSPLGPVRVLTVPFDAWGSVYGPLGARPAATLAAVLDYLAHAPRDYDVLDLRCLRTLGNQGPASAALVNGCSSPEPSASGNEPVLPQLTPWNSAAMIDLAGDWETYWESRRADANRRRNVERCERRLADLGTIAFERYRPRGAAHGETDPRWNLYEACEQLAQKSWQAGLAEGNTLCHAHVREFLRTAHVAAVEAGAIDLSLLYLNERPVAFMYGYHYQGYVDLMRIGFDPELAKVAPGNALWTRVIRDSFARGDTVLDLGPTCLDYKSFWYTRLEPTYRLLQYCPTAKSQAVRLARWLAQPLKRSVDHSNRAAKANAKAQLDATSA